MSVQRSRLAEVLETLDWDDPSPSAAGEAGNPARDSSVGGSEGAILRQHAAVLEAAEGRPRYREVPVSVVCPGCGGVLERYPHGLPARVAYFAESCPECEVQLRRWGSIVIDTVFETAPSLDALEEVTTSRWKERIWSGVTTGDDYARTAEYSSAFEEQAEAFDWEWELRCPLCRQSSEEWSTSRLDYHHWSRRPDRGVCLCRSCHTAVTGGERDRDVDWAAQEVGLKNRYDVQVLRLAIIEQAVAEHGSAEGLAERVCERYNVIQSASAVESMLRQVVTGGEIPEVITRNVFKGCVDG